MKYLSVCSGIEAATQAWHPLGWSPVAFSEIEPFPCKVLAHHYPSVPNLGDMTKFKEWNIEQPDMLVGGTPCQSFSVAGLRKGLDDPRGNLMLTYLAIADRFKPKWIVWENVPGVLSSNGGKDFGTFLGALGELGYGFAYRVLDAQYVRTDGYPHAVPQRRRRVFVVGCFGDWRSAAAVLFDSESLRGNPPPRRSKGKEVAADVANCIRASGVGTERIGDTRGQDSIIAVATTLRAGAANGGKCHGARSGDSKDELIIPVCISHGINDRVAPTLNAAFGHKQGLDNQHIDLGAGLFVFDEAQITSKTNRSRVEQGLPCGTLNKASRMTITLAGNTIGREPQNGGNVTGFDESGASYTPTKTDVHAVAFSAGNSAGSRSIGYSEEHTPPLRAGASGTNQVPTIAFGGDVARTLSARHDSSPCADRGMDVIAQSNMQVRRLTPTECERLQAFPGNFTNIPGASDSARYKALGNSMAVNVMQVIGQRIQMVENLAKERIAA